MFTGIVEETGYVNRLSLMGESGTIEIHASHVLEGTKIGDSIAVNGVCLTVRNLSESGFEADVMAETIRRSSLRQCMYGTVVNLERAMAADGRFGGHIVSGHIDGTGRVKEIRPEGNAIWYEIIAERQIMDGIVKKGSIAIDGISLTVADVLEDSFLVSVIPHTRAVTALSQKVVGDYVNLENDMIGKYVKSFFDKKLVENSSADEENKSHLTYGMLEEYGF